MYIPEHFQAGSDKELHALIAAHPLGALVTRGPDGFDANHIPFELDAEQGPCGTLLAHVARANPVWREVKDGDEVLVIFRAEQGYISPNWYPTKHETHRSVPTWNYSVVHAHGRIAIRDDERYVRTVVARLTHRHEATQPQPWKMSDAPKDYLDQMVKAIVGVEVEITRLTGKFKLSQNRAARDIAGVIGGLGERGDQALARAVAAFAPKQDQ
jgi:transcriptional regulator